LYFSQLFLVRSNKCIQNFHSIISIYKSLQLLFNRLRCQQNPDFYPVILLKITSVLNIHVIQRDFSGTNYWVTDLNRSIIFIYNVPR
jgi:hypothetical protein